ncbi:ATP-binding protein [uncultured Eubacterium sp.]|uniref:ATP-binding protein n=1 Tax=uncultured Eubacterium sp. TaxID=165185 RepID=UPI0025838389|nr:ATP-binding protein [uncultured Eubacterium sp.]
MVILQKDNMLYIEHSKIKTYDRLPAKTYYVCEDQQDTLYLTQRPNMVVNTKIYGSNENKVNKIFKAYSLYDRSFGVLLHGPKGTGKSLMAKMICAEANKKGMPVIIVNKQFSDLPNFIESIEQECVVLFDEFDKVLRTHTYGQENLNDRLLSVFDGTSSGKKIFVLTVNEVSDINQLLINRPGRMHYKLFFGNPEIKTVREYLEDNVEKDKQAVIDDVIEMATQMPLNFDSLRAIAFEINMGSTIEEIQNELNIGCNDICHYEININLKNSATCIYAHRVAIDWNEESVTFFGRENDYEEDIKIVMKLTEKNMDFKTGKIVIPGSNISLFPQDDDSEFKNAKPLNAELSYKAN